MNNAIDFNPRTHKECDSRYAITKYGKSDFNPRTHKECDLVFKRYPIFHTEFQSTHSQGVRQRISKAISSAERFQSTHSQGVRRYFTGIY
ncbi:Hypothetical cytosolic protein [Lactobacillus helveticus H10]|nr:Hypothetical cytosolic protein [Lactobacillus helveticus H10]